MAQPDSRTQIVIACISLVGVLAAAVIANWGKISGSSMPSAASAASAVQQPPEAVGRGGSPRRVAPQLQQPAQALVGENGDTAGTLFIVSATPPRGTVLKEGQLTVFNVTIRYRLTSLPRAPLQIQLHQYDRSPACTGPNHIPAAQHVPMLQGDHMVTVAIPYIVGVGKGTGARGRYDLGLRSGVTLPAGSCSRRSNCRGIVMPSISGVGRDEKRIVPWLLSEEECTISPSLHVSGGDQMKRKALGAIALRTFAVVVAVAAALQARAQDAKAQYLKMAPLDQYLMARDAEIALARSAAPESIARDAEVLFLGRHGYETAVKGKNGFVCIVERSWTAAIDDPDFWNPEVRAPICFNPPGARFNIPLTIRKTESVLAGRSKEQMAEDIKTALDKKELPALEPAAMCFMLSRQGYLNSRDGHWHPHLMFFVPDTDAVTWGAGVPGSPVIEVKDTLGRFTLFMIPVGKWSDGTAESMGGH